MSKFLAPIHYWLYGKIQILEDVEESIIAALAHDQITAYAGRLQTEIAPFIHDTPLESVIDQGNIHGWLNNKIAQAETRQALLLDFALDHMAKDALLQKVEAVYFKEGSELGVYRSDNKLETAPELFKALSDVILEGMPCDRVNEMMSQDLDEIAWQTVQCVHAQYWTKNQIKATDYHQFRAAFSKGFIENANPDYTYTFDASNGQHHRIYKRA